MHALTLLPSAISPAGHRTLIQAVRLHNRLHWTTKGKPGDHDHNQLRCCSQPFEHGSSSGAKRLFADRAAIALPLAIMDPDVALSDLASCATRRIRAKLFRRFHRLCCGCLHTHNMPGSVIIFKLFPLFHQLVGLYHFTRLSAFSRVFFLFSPAWIGHSRKHDEEIWKNSRVASSYLVVSLLYSFLHTK